MWRCRGGMSCVCPSRLEVSRGIVEENRVTLERHWSSSVDLTHANSCQLNSSPMTPTNCAHVTSPSSVFWLTNPMTRSRMLLCLGTNRGELNAGTTCRATLHAVCGSCLGNGFRFWGTGSFLKTWGALKKNWLRNEEDWGKRQQLQFCARLCIRACKSNTGTFVGHVM